MKTNDIANAFHEAADNGDAQKEFDALLERYKAILGDKYELFIYAMYNHHSASFYDYLDDYYRAEFIALHTISSELRDNAKQAIAYEWGSEEQVDASNRVFDICINKGVFTQDEAEKACLKATTSEMMDWVNEKCSVYLERNKCNCQS